MHKPIDLDAELSSLWVRLYADLRDRLRAMAAFEHPLYDEHLPDGITSVSLDAQENIIVTSIDGSTKLIEECTDDVMYAIYKGMGFSDNRDNH